MLLVRIAVLKKIFILILLFLPSLSFASLTEYRPAGPLNARSQNPLYLQFLAMPIESPQTLNQHQFETKVSTTFSNAFEYDPFANTIVNLDMEIWRTAIAFAYGVTDEIDIQIEIPFITNGGGFLDSFIQWYHNLFGLPNGGRELVGNNEFHYDLIQGGNNLLGYTNTAFGFSDITLRFKYIFSERLRLPFFLAATGYVKLPTGQASKGLGSGQLDAGMSLFGEKSIKRFHFVTQVGVAVLGKSNALNPIQKRAFFSFGQSVEFQILDALSVIVQLTGNTSAFKNTNTTVLSDPVLDLNIGFAGAVPLQHWFIDEFFYQWSFSEDIMSRGPSVDFSVLFLMGVRY